MRADKTAVTHIVIALLFVAMAYLQLNDPDPLYWVVTYLLVAALPVMRVTGHRSTGLYFLTTGLCAAGMLMSLSGFFDYLGSGDYGSIGGAMTPDMPHVESAREFLGLVIAVVCLWFYRTWHGGRT